MAVEGCARSSQNDPSTAGPINAAKTTCRPRPCPRAQTQHQHRRSRATHERRRCGCRRAASRRASASRAARRRGRRRCRAPCRRRSRTSPAPAARSAPRAATSRAAGRRASGCDERDEERRSAARSRPSRGRVSSRATRRGSSTISADHLVRERRTRAACGSAMPWCSTSQGGRPSRDSRNATIPQAQRNRPKTSQTARATRPPRRSGAACTVGR